jgi:hypothetical protein
MTMRPKATEARRVIRLAAELIGPPSKLAGVPPDCDCHREIWTYRRWMSRNLTACGSVADIGVSLSAWRRSQGGTQARGWGAMAQSTLPMSRNQRMVNPKPSSRLIGSYPSLL